MRFWTEPIDSDDVGTPCGIFNEQGLRFCPRVDRAARHVRTVIVREPFPGVDYIDYDARFRRFGYGIA